jgi:hypothetical protein
MRGSRSSEGADVSEYPNQPRSRIVLLGTLVALAVLFVVADQIAKAYAQNMIAGKIQSSAGLTTKPSASIKGFLKLV